MKCVLSSLTPQGSGTALDALAAGAIELFANQAVVIQLAICAHRWPKKIKLSARARVSNGIRPASTAVPSRQLSMAETTNKILCDRRIHRRCSGTCPVYCLNCRLIVPGSGCSAYAGQVYHFICRTPRQGMRS